MDGQRKVIDWNVKVLTGCEVQEKWILGDFEEFARQISYPRPFLTQQLTSWSKLIGFVASSLDKSEVRGSRNQHEKRGVMEVFAWLGYFQVRLLA